MYPFYLEIELIKPVIDYFTERKYQIFREVKIGFCRADIVAIKKDETVAIELKLKNWKKALVQARNYKFGSDYVYIAFPLMKSYNVLKKAENVLRKEGIGFLTINEETQNIKEIVKPKKSNQKFGSVTIEEIMKNRHRRKNRI